MLEKRPRHYAAEIMQLKTREERRAALAEVPELYREIVMTHVRCWFELKNHKREREKTDERKKKTGGLSTWRRERDLQFLPGGTGEGGAGDP